MQLVRENERNEFAHAMQAKNNIGVVGDRETVEAREYGDGVHHLTILTLEDYVVGPLPGSAAAQVLVPENAVYTLPAGAQVVKASYMEISLTAAGTAVSTDVGLGSVIGDGSANSALGSAGATQEDYHTGFAVSTAPGGGTEVVSGPVGATAGILTGISLNKAADAKTIYLNAAGTWNANNTGDLTASGRIVIEWVTFA